MLVLLLLPFMWRPVQVSSLTSSWIFEIRFPSGTGTWKRWRWSIHPPPSQNYDGSTTDIPAICSYFLTRYRLLRPCNYWSKVYHLNLNFVAEYWKEKPDCNRFSVISPSSPDGLFSNPRCCFLYRFDGIRRNTRLEVSVSCWTGQISDRLGASKSSLVILISWVSLDD